MSRWDRPRILGVQPEDEAGACSPAPDVLPPVRRLFRAAAGARDDRRCRRRGQPALAVHGHVHRDGRGDAAVWLGSGRVPRRRIVFSVFGFFAAPPGRFRAWASLALPDDISIARAFYIWLSVFNLIVISVAWSVLVDVFSVAQAKRLFGLIAAGASLGGLVGPLLGVLLVERVGACRAALAVGGAAWSRRRSRRTAVQRWRDRSPLVPTRSPRAPAAARRQCVRGRHRGAALAVPARHRRVRAAAVHRQHVPVFRAGAAGRRRRSRIAPTRRRCSAPSTSWSRPDHRARSCSSPAGSRSGSASACCWSPYRWWSRSASCGWHWRRRSRCWRW